LCCSFARFIGANLRAGCFLSLQIYNFKIMSSAINGVYWTDI